MNMTDHRRSIRCASRGIVLVGMVAGPGTTFADAKFKKKELEVQAATQTELTKPNEPQRP